MNEKFSSEWATDTGNTAAFALTRKIKGHGEKCKIIFK